MFGDLKDWFLTLIGRGFKYQLLEASEVVEAGLKGAQTIRRDLNNVLDTVNALATASTGEKALLLKRYGKVLDSIDRNAAAATHGGQSLIDGTGQGLVLDDCRPNGWKKTLEHKALMSGATGLDLPPAEALDARSIPLEEAQARVAGAMKVANKAIADLSAFGEAVEARIQFAGDSEEEDDTALPEEAQHTLKEIGQIVVIALTIALVFRSFFFQPFNIPSGSMKPTLLIGDYLFVSKYSYGYSHKSFPFGIDFFDGRVFERMPKRGDVVVFKLTADGRTDYIKRVVGLPGDQIQVSNGRLYVNGAPVKRTRLEDYWYTDEVTGEQSQVSQYLEGLPGGKSFLTLDLRTSGLHDNTQVFTVPEGHYFFMGDNRDNSQDSRANGGGVGMVPAENIIGKAQIIFISVDGSARLWQVWKWPFAIRYSRLFQKIQ